MAPTPLRLVLLFSLSMVVAGPREAHAGDPSGASALLWRGDLAGAIGALDDWVAVNPSDLDAHELRVDLLLQTDPTRAAQLYVEQSPLPPTSAAAACLAGRATAEPAAALLAYRRGVQVDRKAARCHMGIGSVLRAQGDREGALVAWRRAVSIDAGLAEAWHGIGLILLEQDDRAGARAAALALRAAAPDEAEAWLLLATLTPADALPLLAQGQVLVPMDPRLPVAIARTQFQAGNVNDAVVAYDRALYLDPTDAHLRAERGIGAEVADGRLSQAAAADLLAIREVLMVDRGKGLTMLDQIVTVWPRSGWARQIRGSTRSGVGLASDAEADLRAAVTMMADSPEAAAALGLHLLSQRRAEEALPLLTRAAAARPWDVTLGVAAAIALAESQGPAAGQAVLEQLARTFPGDKGPLLALAQLHLSAGRPDAAWALLAAAVYRWPDPDLLLALAAASRQAGRYSEAARILDALASQTGDARYSSAARAIRAASVPQ